MTAEFWSDSLSLTPNLSVQARIQASAGKGRTLQLRLILTRKIFPRSHDIAALLLKSIRIR